MTPQVDFATLSDEGIARIGLNAAEEFFLSLVSGGVTNGDSLYMVVGITSPQLGWQELGHRAVRPDAHQFRRYVDPDNGKLAPVIRHGVDSVVAYAERGDQIPAGAQRYTGGVSYRARVLTIEQGWMTRVFVGAASGVQGHFDQAVMYTALTTMGALWAQKMLALFGELPE